MTKKLNIKVKNEYIVKIIGALILCILIWRVAYIESKYKTQFSYLPMKEPKPSAVIRINYANLSFDHKSTELISFLKNINFKCGDPPVNFTEFENIPVISDFDCSPPYVEVEKKGRLGNQLCQYMSLWIFRKQFGARILIANYSYNILHEHFSKLTIPHGNNDCFPINSTSTIEGSYKQIYDNFRKSVQYFKSGKPNSAPLLKTRNFITGYPCESGLITHYREELKKELPIRKNILQKANSHLVSVLAKDGFKRNCVTLVSVHVRRTDYLRYTLKHDQFLPDQTYFQQLMNNYRKRFHNAIFAVFSDDIIWCREHLNGPDVIFPGKGDIKNPMFDFTLITLCDHHIIGLGTYSFTSAFLSKGSIAFGVSEKYMKNSKIEQYLCDPHLTPVLIQFNFVND